MKKKNKNYRRQVRKWGAPQDYDENDEMWSDEEDDQKRYREFIQKKYNISDEVMKFMVENRDVEEALQARHQYKIEDVLHNWDQDYMIQVFGGKEAEAEVDAVHEKLKKWLSKRASNSTNGKTGLLNPYIVSLD